MKSTLFTASGMLAKTRPVQMPLRQYERDPFQRRKNSLLPLGSTVQVNIPGAGSSVLRHDVSVWYSPVSLFSPSHPSGTSVSVGWSKLCHSTLEELPPSRRTRLLLSRITARFDSGDDNTDEDDRLDDHTTPREAEDLLSPTSSRLPSSGETRSSADATPDRGLTRLATQTTVCAGTFLYQMPR